MTENELSWQYLAMELGSVESQLAELYERKKRLLKELSSRVDYMREQHRRGEIKMERADDE